MLGWLIRILIVVLVLRALWSLLSGLLGGRARPAPSPPKKQVALVRDPVCGTYLQPSRALSTRTGARVYYFCSEDCQRAFDPDAKPATHEVSS